MKMQRESCRKTSCHFSESWMLLTDSTDPHANRQCSYCSLKKSAIKQANMEINPQNLVLFFFLNVRFLGSSKTTMSGPLPPCYCCPQWLSICLRFTQGRNHIHHYWLLLVLKVFVMERQMSAQDKRYGETFPRLLCLGSVGASGTLCICLKQTSVRNLLCPWI